MRVDINCDLGESFGSYGFGNDKELLPFVTSANIACGFHAGDPATMRRTVRLCMEHHVAIGAHPGLPDLVGFGRRKMDITVQEAYDMVVYQVGALDAFVRAEGGIMRHVKPHGALYNMAAVNRQLADAIAEAVYRVNSGLILYGLSGSELVRAGDRLRLRVANECFADRTYQSDGTLTPRDRTDAMIVDPELAAKQVIYMLKHGKVRSTDEHEVDITADTVCIHGDGIKAVQFATEIRMQLQLAGVSVASF